VASLRSSQTRQKRSFDHFVGEREDRWRQCKADRFCRLQVVGYSPAIAERSYDGLMSKFSTDGKFDPQALKTLFGSLVDLKMLAKSSDTSKLYSDEFLPKP